MKTILASTLLIAMFAGTIYFTYRMAVAVSVVMEFDH
jgi:hypothetical protein